MSKATLHLAVRSLVERVLRNGDLRLDYFGATRAAEGIRIHRQIQSRRPENYKAEVPVRILAATDRYEVSVSGRIDGLFERDQLTVVEEIKTTTRPLESLEQHPDPVHWGQAKCYAYMWACQASLERIAVQVTYAHPTGGGQRALIRIFETAELKSFFEDLLQRYQWFAEQIEWPGRRDPGIAALAFPFDTYRAGQRDMAVAVYRTIRDGGQLLVQAATGIGKTLAALYPAIKALGEGRTAKIIFVTARTTGRLAAESALEILRAKGLRIKSVSLTAKDKICPNPQSACLPEECPFAHGFYDRINDALSEAFHSDALTRAEIEAVAQAHRVCPFELSLELTQWADIVIGDYNYVFDPAVVLRRLFIEEHARYAVLVDEAHNLLERARDMFSADLRKGDVLALRRAVKSELPQINRRLGRINAWMVAARRRCREAGGGLSEDVRPEELVERVQLFVYAAERWLAKNLRTAFREDLLTFFFDCLAFLRVAEKYDACYSTIHEEIDSDWSVQLFCIDPAPQLREVWERCGPAVLFSATLTPADYFRIMLGCSPEAGKLNIPSPFPQENLMVLVEPRISTLFRRRESSLAAVGEAIAALVGRRRGNYLLFFPSYAYLEMVSHQFSRGQAGIRTLTQRTDMSDAERDSFLAAFEQTVTQTTVGFAVMGGVFGEGIDLAGERLTGAVIVGVGLPGICIRRDLIRDYFERRNSRGFEFAYQYPGINRVLQAAGRVIRTEQDRGVVLLIDQRYAQRRYRELLPAHWNVQIVTPESDVGRVIDRFWQE